MGRQNKGGLPVDRLNMFSLEKKSACGNIELDPRIVKAGFDLTAYYVETGLKSFSDYAQKMIEEYGYDVCPYLKSWYLSVRYYPGIDPIGMDSAAQVDNFTVSWDRCN